MAAERPLTSDELGNLGESKFIYLCEEGRPQLIVNKALKDQSGWDFIVEFPHDNRQKVGLDKRQNPMSTRFQQKTLWVDNDRVKFKLSSLERLAKDPGPAFICALKYNEEIECVECYVVHVIDDFLAFVLQRLRQHEASGEKPINQIDVDVYPTKVARRVEPTHDSIVAVITDSVGGDVNEYVHKKREQIENLGFGPKPFDFNFSLPETEKSKFTDSLLGGSQELEVAEIQGSETRFGITLPLPVMSGRVTLNISPAPRDTCDVIFSKDGFRTSVVKAVLYSVPPQLIFEPDQKRMRIAAKGVEVIFRKVATNLTIKTSFPPDFSMSLIEWRNHYGILRMMIAGEINVEFRTRSKTFRGAKIHPRPSRHEIDFGRTAVALDVLYNMLEMLGYSDARLSFDQVGDLERQILLAKSLFEDRAVVNAEAFDLENSVPADTPEILSGVYITYIDVGASLLLIKCHIEGKFNERQIEFHFRDPTSFEPEMRIVSREEYLEFIEASKGLAKAPLVLSSRPSWKSTL